MIIKGKPTQFSPFPYKLKEGVFWLVLFWCFDKLLAILKFPLRLFSNGKSKKNTPSLPTGHFLYWR
ncbi:hypothetical protein DSCO28_01720 [Desulfosarcina ovata subsp. sediminis]|uniref:Uncharacterized protein n=1 Tax=Desulfosarcina ovata subsp. sediminis TaxID=885957 RepID=A0A5K7ZF72_9BACT|nr:hypothetical protein DSCO28_01720 [Desulfosarcina ovata subsp. sediminis]